MAHRSSVGLALDRERIAAFAPPRVPASVTPFPNIRRVSGHETLPPHGDFPELDCIRHRVPAAILAAVERRAIEVGVGADRVLIATGICDEDSYMRALADWLGLDYETFDGRTHAHCPIDAKRLVEGVRTGLLPLVIDRQLSVVVAPRSVRQFVSYASRNPQLRFRLTSTERLNRFVYGANAEKLGRCAAAGLHSASPHLSAASRALAPGIVVAAAVILIAAALIAFPGPAFETVGAMLTAGFVIWLLMRTAMSHLGRKPSRPPRIADSQLPVYTVIAALYREGASVKDLVHALTRLDYPALGSKCT